MQRYSNTTQLKLFKPIDDDGGSNFHLKFIDRHLLSFYSLQSFFLSPFRISFLPFSGASPPVYLVVLRSIDFKRPSSSRIFIPREVKIKRRRILFMTNRVYLRTNSTKTLKGIRQYRRFLSMFFGVPFFLRFLCF